MEVCKVMKSGNVSFWWSGMGVFVLVLLLLAPGSAFAYVGPGAGLGAVGTVIALLVSVALLVVGFVWYPVKRMIRRCKGENVSTDSDSEQS